MGSVSNKHKGPWIVKAQLLPGADASSSVTGQRSEPFEAGRGTACPHFAGGKVQLL